MFSSLQGSRTYIIALLLGVVAAAQYLGLVDAALAAQLHVLLTGGGLAALRAGVESSK